MVMLRLFKSKIKSVVARLGAHPHDSRSESENRSLIILVTGDDGHLRTGLSVSYTKEH